MRERGDVGSICSKAQLLIDDVPIINDCAPFPGGTAVYGTVDLLPGWHKVDLRLETNGPGGGLNPRGLEWMWTRPDGVHEVVPPTRLRYTSITMPATPPVWPKPTTPLTCNP